MFGAKYKNEVDVHRNDVLILDDNTEEVIQVINNLQFVPRKGETIWMDDGSYRVVTSIINSYRNHLYPKIYIYVGRK